MRAKNFFFIARIYNWRACKGVPCADLNFAICEKGCYKENSFFETDEFLILGRFALFPLLNSFKYN